jgi:hypothetical protein
VLKEAGNIGQEHHHDWWVSAVGAWKSVKDWYVEKADLFINKLPFKIQYVSSSPFTSIFPDAIFLLEEGLAKNLLGNRQATRLLSLQCLYRKLGSFFANKIRLELGGYFLGL